MPKPFSLQAPEDIAKEYGGNKQKIAQAMQTGLVDPTAGTLAGMFIDRMRSAQMQEGAQQPSVAQQVFAPPAPPAPPMGAPPPGAPPAPPMGAPPMGGMPPAPPMGAPPMGGMPPGAPPMGMADGGLAMLPIPESMFDEPMDGEYANGGIVSFADAGLTSAPDYEQILRDNMAYYRDPQNFMRDINAAYQPKREYAERANQFNKDLLSEEGQKKRRDEDKYFALAQLGATMASTPGSLFQSFSAGVNKALPGLQEATKERRAEVRDALKQLAADEGMTNAEQRAFVLEGMKGRGEAGKIANDFAQRASAKELAQMQEAGALQRANISAGATKYAADKSKEAQISYLDKQAINLVKEVKAKAVAELPALRAAPNNPVGVAHNAYKLAMATGTPAQQKLAEKAMLAAERAFVDSQVALVGDAIPPSLGAEVGAVPGGKIVVKNGRREFVPGG